MDNVLVPVPLVTLSAREAQADNDEQVVRLWLHNKSPRTQEVYGAYIDRFLAFVGKRLYQVKLRDVQAYADSLTALAPATRARMLACVKSLFAFAHKRLGYLPFDTAAPVKLPAIKSTLAGRILAEEAIQRMLALESNARNHALLRLFYAAGLRVSELCTLTWADCGHATTRDK